MKRYTFAINAKADEEEEYEVVDYPVDPTDHSQNIKAYAPEWGEKERIDCRHGDNLEFKTSTEVIRTYFQNFNGFNLSNEGAEFLDELSVLKELDADIIMAAETNVNWSKGETYDTTKRLFNKVWKKNRLAVSNCKERTKTTFQPGGTCTVSTGKWVSYTKEIGQDGLGRWSWVTLKGKNNRKVTFITVYRVCDANLSTAGPSTCWMQQWRKLKKDGKLKPNPRSQVLTDLDIFLNDLVKADHHIVLGIDANEDIAEKKALHEFVERNDLVDAFQYAHPHATPPATYIRGTKRLDYLFVSPEILPALSTIGYLPFHLGIFSDHCAIFADFNAKILLDGVLHNPIDVANRKLVSSNPKRVDNYIRMLTDLFKEHRIVERVQELRHEFENKIYPLHTCIEKYETLDSQITEFMLRAEKKCCKAKQGYAWSLKLVEAGRLVRYWKLRKSNHLNNIDGDTQQLADFLNIDNSPLSLSEIDKNLTSARKHLKEVQENAQEIRDDYLEELAAMQQHKYNCGVASIIKNIKHCEELRTAFKKIGNVTKEVSGGVVNSIKVPTTTKIGNNAMYEDVTHYLGFEHAHPFDTIDDSDEVMTRLLHRNKLHLHQAFDTPFASPEMEKRIGEFGTGPGAQEIIDGRFDSNEVDNLPEVNFWLKHHIRRVSTDSSIKVRLSVEEFKSLFKSQSENTSSSKSGRHYGHYKAAIENDDICLVHSNMMSLPFEFGFTPGRWVHAIDVMLEKDPGDPKIHRLRIIVLVEADMNSIMKVIWNRRLVPVSENTTLDSPYQFGNKKGRTALDALLLKIVTMDSIRLFRLNGGLLNNDATACYDRMIPTVTSLHLQSLGFSKEATKCSVLLNRNMRHHIKTETGISEVSYSHSPDYGKYGEGQGKASSPPNWRFTSSTLLNALHNLVNRSWFESICRNHISHRVAEGYVDDVDGYQVDQKNQDRVTTREITTNIQKLTQTWANLLHGSGGELSIKKSSWYLLWWKWDKGTATLCTNKEAPGEVLVTSAGSNKQQCLHRNEPDESLRQLGVLTNPTGDYSAEYEKRIKHSRSLGQRIKRSSVTRKNAWRIYRNVWLPAGQYPLSVTSWTEDQCEDLMSPFLNAILPKLGFNRNMPRAVVHGSNDYGGFEMAHFYIEQGYLGLKHLVGHLREMSVTGNHILITLSMLHLLSGLDCGYLSNVDYALSYIPDNWMKGIRRFLQRCNGSVEIPGVWLPKPQRKEDQLLMKSFHTLCPSDATILHLQKVRLFLRATTTADITDDTGTHIQPWALTGSAQATSTIPWPYQGKPGATSWRVWRRFLKATLATSVPKYARTNHPWKLDVPLGTWTTDQPYTLRDTYYDPTTKSVFVKQVGSQQFLQHHLVPGFITRFKTQDPQPTNLPLTAIPATAKNEGTHYLCLAGVNSSITSNSHQLDNQSFADYISALPFHMRRLLGTLLEETVDTAYWVNAIKENKVTVASDGSVKEGNGTFAVIFHTEERELRFQGPVDCDSSLIQSYRAELSGILAAYYFLKSIHDFSKATMSSFPEIHVDNSAAVSTNNKKDTRVGVSAHTAADIDLILEIEQLKAEGYRMEAKWVEAHQDTKHPTRELDLPAKLNCIVDKDAASYHNNSNTSQTPPSFPAAGAILTVNGIVITNNMQTILRDAANPTNLRRHILTKTGWTNSQFDSIVWKSHGKALRSLDMNDKIQVVKFLHNWLPTGERNKFINPHDSNLCPSCLDAIETWRHLFQCKSEVMIAVKTSAVAKFRSHLIKHKTNPIIRSTLVFQVCRWLQVPATPPIIPSDQIGCLVNQAVVEQSELNWENLLKGRIVSQWGKAQQLHLNIVYPKESSTATDWEKQAILGIWKIALTIWNERNSLLHDTAAAEEDPSVLNKQIKVAYSHLQHSMSSTDVALFDKSLQERISTTATSKRFWLDAVTIAVDDYIIVNKRHPTQRTITEFFSTPPSPVPTFQSTPATNRPNLPAVSASFDNDQLLADRIPLFHPTMPVSTDHTLRFDLNY